MHFEMKFDFYLRHFKVTTMYIPCNVWCVSSLQHCMNNLTHVATFCLKLGMLFIIKFETRQVRVEFLQGKPHLYSCKISSTFTQPIILSIWYVVPYFISLRPTILRLEQVIPLNKGFVGGELCP